MRPCGSNVAAMKPLIGICAYGPLEIRTDSRHYEHHYAVPTEYVDAVRRAGGATVLLSGGEDSVDRWLVALDGVIVTGGTDVDPRMYGGDADNARVRAVAPSRDDMEMALGRAVLATGIPTLFVCRGLQVLNVLLGGTLHPHLPDLGRGDIHRNEDGLWTKHAVNVESGSLLATAMGATGASPTSGHHQGVDRLGERLEIVAVAPDGVIEGLEVPGHTWAVAVQWHPEVTAAEDATQQGIFDALVRAASLREIAGG